MQELVRHCYLVQSHRDPRQILRLVQTLRRGSPDSRIFVYHDASRCPLDSALFVAVPGCELLFARGPVQRGDFSLVEAYLDAAARIRERGLSYGWLTLLSGQDYPIKPLAEYERRLEQSSAQGLLCYGDVLGPDNPWPHQRHRGHRRYFYRYRRLAEFWRPWLRALRWVNGLQSWVHLQTTYDARFGMRLSRPPFGSEVRCYAGSGWHALRLECVAFLLELWAAGDPLVEHFRHTITPDEAFWQTVLVNCRRFALENENLRFVEFDGSRCGSPRTLTGADLGHLLASPKYFARKFDPAVDEGVLDAIDTHLFPAENGKAPG